MAKVTIETERDSVPAVDLSEKVLEHIRRRGPSKVKQIVDALGADKAAVSSALYGPLHGKVEQSRDYTWPLAEAPKARRDASARPNNAREGPIAYYLDCLSQDDDSGVRTFADSKFELDYVELEGWPLEDAWPNFSSPRRI